MDGIKHIVVRHIENNLFKYIVALTCFAVGVVVGVINSFGTETAAMEEIRSVFESLPEAEFDTTEILKTSFFKNLRYLLLVFIGGFSAWLLPVSFFSVFTYGFSYGYTVACMTTQMSGAGFAMSFVSVLPGLVLTVPLCAVMCVLAINRNANRKHNRSGKDVVGYVVCCGILFVLNLIVVPVDALLMPEIIRQICASLKL